MRITSEPVSIATVDVRGAGLCKFHAAVACTLSPEGLALPDARSLLGALKCPQNAPTLMVSV